MRWPGAFRSCQISIIDTRAEDAKGNKYNVEVQVRTQADYQERSLYYWAKSYSEQLQDGEFYGSLKRVTSISILNYRLFPKHIPCHSCYMLRENNSREDVLTEDCIMHYLEVPKLSGKPEKEIEKWLYFINHGDKEDETVRVLLSKDRMMQEAKRRYEYFVADERARIAYQQREKFLRDQANYIHTAKMEGLSAGREEGLELGKAEGLELGKAAGLEQGLEVGKAKGLQQGLEQGRTRGLEEGAKQKALETARKLKDMGMSAEQIKEATGLEDSELDKL